MEAQVVDETAETTEISIVDDKGVASSIALFAKPEQIYEGDGGKAGDVPVEIEITAILNGPALGSPVALIPWRPKRKGYSDAHFGLRDYRSYYDVSERRYTGNP